jgi:hypothetical protein
MCRRRLEVTVPYDEAKDSCSIVLHDDRPGAAGAGLFCILFPRTPTCLLPDHLPPRSTRWYSKSGCNAIRRPV